MSQGFFSGYVYVAVFLLAGPAFVAAGLLTARILAPKRVTVAERLTTYESGETPYGQAWARFPVRFYIIGLLFVVFDVEAIFILAWATIFRTLGLLGFAEVLFFIVILGLGLAYAWRKGALTWM